MIGGRVGQIQPCCACSAPTRFRFQTLRLLPLSRANGLTSRHGSWRQGIWICARLETENLTCNGMASKPENEEKSYNIPTILVAQQVGPERFSKWLKPITTLIEDGHYTDINFSMALGGLSKALRRWKWRLPTARSVTAANTTLQLLLSK